MTPPEYWKREINKADALASDPEEPDRQSNPQIMAALIIAGQLQAIATVLVEIRTQLDKIEDSIANQ